MSRARPDLRLHLLSEPRSPEEAVVPRRPQSKYLLTLLALGVVYLIAGKLGLKLAFVNPSASAVWPPTGIAVAALLLLGYRVWPAIMVGAFLVNVTTAGTVLTSLGIAAGNTLEALSACYLVNRFANGCKAFDRAHDVFRFAFLASVIGPAVSATLGVASLCFGGFASWSGFGEIWLTWWFGDGAGAIVIAPLLILWRTNPRVVWRKQGVELLTLLAGVFLAGQTVFGGLFPAATRNYPLEFLCIPLLIWAAYRFDARVTATAVFLLSGIAIRGTLTGFGPFVRDSANQSLVLLQLFVGVCAVMSLSLAALVGERNQHERLLQGLAATDSLTGLANYRRFMEMLAEEVNRSLRTLRPFSILLLDLDGLKKINDSHGHLAGNQALKRLACVLRDNSRAIDTAARFGGDEFVMLLVETKRSAARQVAKRLFGQLTGDPEPPALSVSFGISSYPDDGETVERLLEAADQALYQMKRRHAKSLTIAVSTVKPVDLEKSPR